MATTRGAKRQREEGKPVADDNTGHQRVLDCLLSELSSSDAPKLFWEQKSALEKDRALLRALKNSMEEIEERLTIQEKEMHQENSVFNNLLDRGVSDHIFDFLDEEGLWVLEESTMMRLETEAVNAKWEGLWRQRKSQMPDCLYHTSFSEEALDSEFPFRFKWYGIAFAQASRMARWMERLAQSKYGTNLPIIAPASQSETEGIYQWPEEEIKLPGSDERQTIIFIRISYLHDEARPPMVLEGFAERSPEYDEELVFSLRGVEKTVLDTLIHPFRLAMMEESDYVGSDFNQHLEDAKREFCDHLSITIVEIMECYNEDSYGDGEEREMKHIISTTGYQEGQEDEDFLFLVPRNDDLSCRGDVIQVGIRLVTRRNEILIRLNSL